MKVGVRIAFGGRREEDVLFDVADRRGISRLNTDLQKGRLAGIEGSEMLDIYPRKEC
jgi:hypothetical protein